MSKQKVHCCILWDCFQMEGYTVTTLILCSSKTCKKTWHKECFCACIPGWQGCTSKERFYLYRRCGKKNERTGRRICNNIGQVFCYGQGQKMGQGRKSLRCHDIRNRRN